MLMGQKTDPKEDIQTEHMVQIQQAYLESTVMILNLANTTLDLCKQVHQEDNQFSNGMQASGKMPSGNDMINESITDIKVSFGRGWMLGTEGLHVLMASSMVEQGVKIKAELLDAVGGGKRKEERGGGCRGMGGAVDSKQEGKGKGEPDDDKWLVSRKLAPWVQTCTQTGTTNCIDMMEAESDFEEKMEVEVTGVMAAGKPKRKSVLSNADKRRIKPSSGPS